MDSSDGRWIADLVGRIAVAADQGGGLDAFRSALITFKEHGHALDEHQRVRAGLGIWDGAVRHLEDVIGIDVLASIYTTEMSESPPMTEEELDETAIKDVERRESQAEIERLSKLKPIEYERERHAVADALGWRVTFLDDQVIAVRKAEDPVRGQGRPLKLPEVEPWGEEVDGAALLDDIAAAIKRFVVLSDAAADSVALWCVSTHTFQSFPIFPRLVLRSPTPRCGKTTLRDVVAKLVAKPLPADSIMAAALFRTIELEQPTLLLDEADTFLPGNEDLRGVINSGHRRDGQIIRCVGNDHEPRQFSTWAPMLIALIGDLPDTIHDRSVIITMARKNPSEVVNRLGDFACAELAHLARKAARWTRDNSSTIEALDPASLPGLNDRANDNWRPLQEIAAAAGGSWPERASKAAYAITESVKDDSVSIGETLLADIQSIFGDKKRISSEELVQALVATDGRPWAEWKSGKPVSQNSLARLLKQFKIKPGTVRLENNETAKGYKREDFDDAFKRYGALATVTPSQLNEINALDALQTVTSAPAVTVGNAQKPNDFNGCDGVTVGEGPGDEEASWTV